MRGLAALPPEADDTFLVKIYHFVTVLSIAYRYLHSMPTSLQCETEEKSIWRQNSGRASKDAYQLGTKKWANDDCPVLRSPAVPSEGCAANDLSK